MFPITESWFLVECFDVYQNKHFLLVFQLDSNGLAHKVYTRDPIVDHIAVENASLPWSSCLITLERFKAQPQDKPNSQFYSEYLQSFTFVNGLLHFIVDDTIEIQTIKRITINKHAMMIKSPFNYSMDLEFLEIDHFVWESLPNCKLMPHIASIDKTIYKQRVLLDCFQKSFYDSPQFANPQFHSIDDLEEKLKHLEHVVSAAYHVLLQSAMLCYSKQ